MNLNYKNDFIYIFIIKNFKINESNSKIKILFNIL